MGPTSQQRLRRAMSPRLCLCICIATVLAVSYFTRNMSAAAGEIFSLNSKAATPLEAMEASGSNAKLQAQIQTLTAQLQKQSTESQRAILSLREQVQDQTRKLQQQETALKQRHNVMVGHLPTAQSKQPGATNSATGKVFQGLKIRDFSGPRLFTGTVLPPGGGRRSLAPQTQNKWAVVTTIFEPSDAVKYAAQLGGWCIVIVADTKTPENYLSSSGLDKEEGVVFLTVAMQRGMISSGDAFVGAVPWKHFSRKNIGYLYAIRHGAEFIFDFDDDNELQKHSGHISSPLPDNDQDLQNVRMVSLASGVILNPYPLMEPTELDTWPRGFPLELIKSNITRGTVTASSTTVSLDKVAIVQLCANHDPDVDAIYRLTRNHPFNFKAAPAGQGLLVPPGIYTPYNAQAVVHTKNALFACFLPSTVPGRVSDIWRSYFAERLFADLDLSIAFVPPRVTQMRNVHNYLGDMNAEEDLYYKTSKLVEFLSAGWVCTLATVPGCMEDLWVALYERGYIEQDDVKLLQQWLQALIDSGYEFPPLQPSPRGASLPRRSRPARRRSSPAWEQSTREPKPQARQSPEQRAVSPVKQAAGAARLEAKPICPRISFAPQDVLVIVVFNSPFFDNIPTYLNLYEPFFPGNFVFCSDKKVDDPRFIVADQLKKGVLSYQCTLIAMQKFPGKTGYLTTGDDVLMNVPRLFSVGTDAMWLAPISQHLHLDKPSIQNKFALWDRLKVYGLEAAKRISQDLLDRDIHLDWAHAPADIFYFPEAARELFIDAAAVFLRHQSYFSHAVPTIMLHIQQANNKIPMKELKGSMLWFDKKNRFGWEEHKEFPTCTQAHFFHPFKLSGLATKEQSAITRACSFLDNCAPSSFGAEAPLKNRRKEGERVKEEARQ